MHNLHHPLILQVPLINNGLKIMCKLFSDADIVVPNFLTFIFPGNSHSAMLERIYGEEKL